MPLLVVVSKLPVASTVLAAVSAVSIAQLVDELAVPEAIAEIDY